MLIMKTTTSLRYTLVALAASSLSTLAFAHPGHDHSDIPRVIRHPFAGAEHAFVTATVIAALVLTAAVLARKALKQARWRPD